jgi:ubiquinone/menaquinone biosynthesis C-methylase UbiE
MNNSYKFYSKQKIGVRNKFNSKKKIIYGIDSTELLVDKILSKVKNESKILDIGTGTGHLPKLICNKTNKKFSITACDLSEKMIEIANKMNNDSRIFFEIADNFALPYADKSFDLVIGKLVTNFSQSEIFRILKPKGFFIFKEYGEFKGLKEIKELFPKRVNSKSPYYYIKSLQLVGFSKISVDFFYFARKYTKKEINQVLNMAPIIKDYSKKDWGIIEKKMFVKSNSGFIGSDPFILIAQK